VDTALEVERVELRLHQIITEMFKKEKLTWLKNGESLKKGV
jgi:hypothetical protein